MAGTEEVLITKLQHITLSPGLTWRSLPAELLLPLPLRHLLPSTHTPMLLLLSPKNPGFPFLLFILFTFRNLCLSSVQIAPPPLPKALCLFPLSESNFPFSPTLPLRTCSAPDTRTAANRGPAAPTPEQLSSHHPPGSPALPSHHHLPWLL